MQKLLLSLAGLALAFTVILSTGCNPDGDDPTDPTGPDARFVTEVGFLDGSADVEVGQTFKTKVSLLSGDSKLQSVTIYEDDVKLGTSFFTINGGALLANNPFLITGADKDGVTYEFEISTVNTVGAVRTYEVEVADEKGLTDAVSLTITSKAPATTPIEMSLTGVLLNQAGPVGQGGLDLDNGQGTASDAASAEIRDVGIDCGLPDASNWRKQIGTINGAEMRRVRADMVENFSFANATNKEIIAAAFQTGSSILDTNQAIDCQGNATIVRDMTLALVVGDMFAISANSKIYLIRVDEVNNTSNNNDDNYKLSIKY
ncbi:MAG: hypothetical protein SH848_00375 [Saprospiraceae bacterium]|nr:hypothetical protein [Saprospiraceae bacterium]MDZ4702351.1 hypothetical protein [Saprospiraceae bacterium]